MSRQKKLLVIAGGAYVYGAEKVTLDVLEGLRDSDYQLEAIISGWGDGRFAAALDKLHIRYHKLKLGWYYTSKILWSLDSLIHYPGAITGFLKIRKQFKDWPLYIISYRQLVLLWPFIKNKVVYHVHDPNAASRLSRFFVKLADRKVARYVAVSAFIKEDLVNCGVSPDKISVIHNGVEKTVPFMHKQTECMALTAGIVGQIIPRKGHEDLLEAVSILRRKGKNISLIIAGQGDQNYIRHLQTICSEKEIAGYVEWRGYAEDKTTIYKGMDLVVAPSRTDEPFALVVLEANMFGIPVIATQTGGFAESITEGENGFLAQPSDPAGLAEKIEKCCNNRALLDRMGENARERALREFTKDIMVNKIDNLIQSI